FCQQLLGHEPILSVPQDKGQKGEDEGVQDAHDGQDVGPADRTCPDAVLVCLLPTHLPHCVTIPAIRVDHAAQDQAH
ncbi:hypothetical protein NL108_003188, partial [Boleophthalmus pectinirostris]